MHDLLSQVRGYLESAEFRVILEQSESLVADKILFGQDRDTIVVWTIPLGQELTRYEATLRGSISKLRQNYPDAKGYVLAPSRAGFSRELLRSLADSRIKLLAPIEFFDTAFKVEEAPKAASAIADLRSLGTTQKRVPQPYRLDGEGDEAGDDLFETLAAELAQVDAPCVRVVVGRAGIGKSFLFRALFASLYEEFLTAKAQRGSRPRPIPMVPQYLKGTYALRTEALVDSFLRTDVATPVRRETFEWLLANGFTTWLLDGLDELYSGDPHFFDYLLDPITRKDSRAQVTIFCRDSLLTTSDQFIEFHQLCSGSSALRVYRLSDWERRSKRHFTWLGLEGRPPRSAEADPPQVAAFLREIDNSKTLQMLSGLPFYCELLLQQHRDGQLRAFSDDVGMLNFVVDQMIKRELEKGVINLDLFEPNGLQEWLEQIAVSYVEGQRYADIDRDEAVEFGHLVLRSSLDEKTKKDILISLLQFPLFRSGTQSGRIAFAHDLIAEALAARQYLRTLRRNPGEVARRLARVDLEAPTLLRFMASRLDADAESALLGDLERGMPQGRGFAVLLTIALLARPERDLVKRLSAKFENRDLAGVRFSKRDLSGVSFRQADLSNAAFDDCDLQGARFEGAFLSRTRFGGTNLLQDAHFGDLGRVQSLWIGKKLIEDPEQLRDWVAKNTGKPLSIVKPCPSALQLAHLFGKFITPLGLAKRDELRREGLLAGRRYERAASTEAILAEAVKRGYLTRPDFKGRFRRAEGDKYGEMVRFVRDGSVSDGLGRLIGELCPVPGCLHMLRTQ